jgi:hypothetical protein
MRLRHLLFTFPNDLVGKYGKRFPCSRAFLMHLKYSFSLAALSMLVLIGAGPASQPTTRPDDDLRRIIANLQAEVAQLRRENATLKQRATLAETTLAKQAATVAAHDAQPAPDGLQIGMTMEEAQAWPKIKGLTAVNTGGDADGSKTYEWHTVEAVDGKGYTVTYYATFKDGKIVSHYREAIPKAPPRSTGTFGAGASRGLW